MKSCSLNAASRRAVRAAAHREAARRGACFSRSSAMVAIMLAAVALVRSVDTSAMISGNLAFQQSATASGDGGTETAITWLAGIEAANASMNVLIDDNHPFNANNAAMGYFASLDPAKSLTASTGSHFNWDNSDSRLLAQDSSGNTTRYIIQRMCRTAGIKVKDAGCLFSGAQQNNNKQNILLPQEICKGDGCPVAGQTPMLRITSRTTGPKNTLSYVQAFVY